MVEGGEKERVRERVRERAHGWRCKRKRKERVRERQRRGSRHNTPRNGQSVSAKVGCSVGTLPERETRSGSACLLHRHDSLVQEPQRCKDRENARTEKVID